MEIAALVIILGILVVSILPVWVGAKIVGANRGDFLWCFVAMLLSGILQAVGTLVPIFGNIVAFLLVGWGFAMVLQTGFIKGLIIHLIQIVFWAVFAGIASVMFGVAVLGVFMA